MGRNNILKFKAVRGLAEEKLAQANARIRHNGGNIRYELYQNVDGTFTINVSRMYRDENGYSRFKYLYSVLC